MLSERRVIALIGPAGAGKSTIAKYLHYNYGVARRSIAKEIKATMKRLYDTDDKATLIPVRQIGQLERLVTGREMLQDIGAALRWVDTDVWLKVLARELLTLSETTPVVIDDVRLDSEIAYLKSHYQTWVVLVSAPLELRTTRSVIAGERDITETNWQHVKFDMSIDSSVTPAAEAARLIAMEALS